MTASRHIQMNKMTDIMKVNSLNAFIKMIIIMIIMLIIIIIKLSPLIWVSHRDL